MPASPDLERLHRRFARRFVDQETHDAFACSSCSESANPLFKAAPCAHTLCKNCAEVSNRHCRRCDRESIALIECPEFTPLIERSVVFACRTPDCTFTTVNADEAFQHVCDSVIDEWKQRVGDDFTRENVATVLSTAILTSHDGGLPGNELISQLFSVCKATMHQNSTSQASKPPAQPRGTTETATPVRTSTISKTTVRVEQRAVPKDLLVPNTCVTWALTHPFSVSRWCRNHPTAHNVHECKFAHAADGYVVIDGYPEPVDRVVENNAMRLALVGGRASMCLNRTEHDPVQCSFAHFKTAADADRHEHELRTEQLPPPEPPRGAAPRAQGDWIRPRPPDSAASAIDQWFTQSSASDNDPSKRHRFEQMPPPPPSYQPPPYGAHEPVDPHQHQLQHHQHHHHHPQQQQHQQLLQHHFHHQNQLSYPQPPQHHQQPPQLMPPNFGSPPYMAGSWPYTQ
jgi:hypothetical protein